MRHKRKQYYHRAAREVWYIGPRAYPQHARMRRFQWPDQYASEGHTFVCVYAHGRWTSFEAPLTDLEIRSQGKRYPYMLYPAGGSNAR